MKNSKRLLAMMTAGFLAITPMAATGLTAYAVTHSLTVTDTDTVSHSYTAYPIITGTKHDDGTLTDIAWGTGINSANLISALKSNASVLEITLGENPSIDDVAEALASITAADKIEKLAKILNTAAIRGSSGTSLTKDGNNYSATVDDGWYLVVDETTLAAATDMTSTQVRSANLLQIVGDITVNTKHSLPTLEKKIVEGSSEVDYNTASIGDTITYHIKTKVPDTRGYEKYFFIVDDTLSAGLTFGSVTSIIVYDDKDDEDEDTSLKKTLSLDTDEDYTNGTGDYYVTPTGNNVKIVFENIIDRLKTCTPGDDIIITCTATLNDNAVITNDGNTNSAKLTYSNDPNVTGSGKDDDHPDEPGGNTPPIGETPEDTVKTYTTAIKIKKVDTSGKVLEGAGFTLTGVSSEQALVITNSFTVDSSGSYWKLKDGTYTTTDPNGDGVDKTKYESETTKYAKTTTTTLKGTGQTETSISAMVGTDGCIVFQGLGPGNYRLTESTVPATYNAIDPIDFEISAAPTASVANWTISGFEADTDNTYKKTIENRKGSVLPTTGGIGTKLFYIIGGLLVAGSVVLLVTKKRMKANED